jgi:hypothetical protein
LRDVRVRDNLEGLGIDGKIILNYNYNKLDGTVWNGPDLEREKWRDVENTEVILPVS